jgi:hypothetical protein
MAIYQSESELSALWAKHHGRNQTCVYDLNIREEFELVEEEAAKEAKNKVTRGERP